MDKVGIISQIANNVIYQMIISISNIFISSAFDILSFLLYLINQMGIALLYNEVSISIYHLFGICAIGFAVIGTAFSIQDYINVLDDTNSSYKNLNPKDFIMPIAVAFIFAHFYIDITLIIFKEITKLNDIMLSMISATGNMDFINSYFPNSVDALFITIIDVISCIIFTIAAFSLLKQQITKAPIIMINMISGLMMPFAIARGDMALVFQYIKSVFGIGIPMVVKSVLLVWGIKYMYINPLIGFGLIICSIGAEQILKNFAFTMSTKTGYSNAFRTASGLISTLGRM